MRSFCVIFFFIIVACDSNQLVRQNAFFAPEFKSSIYNLFESPCGFTFLRNNIARIETVDDCNFNIIYNDLNAEIFLTTINLNSNFREVNQIFDEKIYENSSTFYYFLFSVGLAVPVTVVGMEATSNVLTSWINGNELHFG